MNSLSQNIIWKNFTKLQFSDFKYPIIVKPSNGEIKEIEYIGDYPNPAQSIVGISYTLQIEYGILTSNIYSFFYPFHSYILSNTDSQVLHHEQVHFDIYELYARKMKKYLHDSASIYETKEYLILKIDSIRKEAEIYSSFYDDVTYGGGNLWEQLKWNKSIISQIDSLSDYAAFEMKIRLKR